MSRCSLLLVCLLAAGCSKGPAADAPMVKDVGKILGNPKYADSKPVISVYPDGTIAAKLDLSDDIVLSDEATHVASIFRTSSPNEIEMVFDGPEFEHDGGEIVWLSGKGNTSIGQFERSTDGRRLSKSVASTSFGNVGSPIDLIKVGGIQLEPGTNHFAIAIIYLCSKDPFYAAVVREAARKNPKSMISPKDAIQAILDAEKACQAK